MLEKYDQFTQRKQNLDRQIDNQKKQYKKRVSGLKRQKLALKMSQLKTQMNQFINGPSGFSRDNF
jgi:hypothetical protein